MQMQMRLSPRVRIQLGLIYNQRLEVNALKAPPSRSTVFPSRLSSVLRSAHMNILSALAIRFHFQFQFQFRFHFQFEFEFDSLYEQSFFCSLYSFIFCLFCLQPPLNLFVLQIVDAVSTR